MNLEVGDRDKDDNKFVTSRVGYVIVGREKEINLKSSCLCISPQVQRLLVHNLNCIDVDSQSFLRVVGVHHSHPFPSLTPNQSPCATSSPTFFFTHPSLTSFLEAPPSLTLHSLPSNMQQSKNNMQRSKNFFFPCMSSSLKSPNRAGYKWRRRCYREWRLTAPHPHSCTPSSLRAVINNTIFIR